GSYRFPLCPASWHYLAPARSLQDGPVATALPPGARYVGYRTESGKLAVLDARCAHVGSDLSKGAVTGECLRCPLHGWEYDAGGTCVRIPAGAEIPRWARQATYPVEQIGGHVFFFNRPQATFPFPTFAGIDWAALHPARPFELVVDAPWHVVSANGFDLQHFRFSHDRELIGDPRIDAPHALARRLVARFRVVGRSWRDALTRSCSGPELTMTVTDWVGSLVLVTAQFSRTTSYGLVTLRPLDQGRTLARVIVFVRRRASGSGHLLNPLEAMDGLDAWIRRGFIRAFLQPDVELTAGVTYHPRRLIGPDQILRDHLEWLEHVHASPGPAPSQGPSQPHPSNTAPSPRPSPSPSQSQTQAQAQAQRQAAL
ncbi:MAG TPA: Rieske 2Fe-2S domain-containing protein, partial [Gemmatimonadales bacterium]|nr:Rieske 2Fe-2S domain-containing protein [Gemmatimonadales bacterium]